MYKIYKLALEFFVIRKSYTSAKFNLDYSIVFSYLFLNKKAFYKLTAFTPHNS